MMTTKPLVLAAASLTALMAAQAGHAQVQEPVAEAGDEVIVVTAQLRQQDPVEVPIALTAYSGRFLDELGIDEFEELGDFVPGFEVQNQSPNNPGFVIRGITSDSGDAYEEPRVSVFQDGVSISKSRGSYVELFDLERVEISKGPQSTLYGRGALIGAVNLVQNKARPGRVEGLVRGSYGNYDAWSLEGMVNLPIGEQVAVRVAGRIKERDGYVENLLGGRDFNSTDTGAIRGAFHAGGDTFRIDIIGNYQKDEPAGTAFKSINFNPTDPTTGVVIGDRGRFSGAALAPGAGFEGGRDLGLDREVWGVTGLAEWEISETLTLNSVSAYREFDSYEVFDSDGLSLPILTAAEEALGEQTSQELRLTYDDGGPITAFIGASYFDEEVSTRTPAQFDERLLLARFAGLLNGPPALGRPITDPAPNAVFGSTAFTAALLQGVAAARGVAVAPALAQAIAANLKSAHVETATNASDTQSFDVFGDVTVRISDRFEVGAGLRYTRDDKTTRFSSAVLNGRSILGGFIGALGQPAAVRDALLGALAVPGAATIPPSATYPVPLFGLTFQPTANNGDVDSADLENDGFTWRMFARYSPSEDSSLYATYSRGRRPQVLATSAPGAPNGPANFDLLSAETVDSFEVGGKTNLADRTLYADASLFYYRYKNFQTTVQQGTIFVPTNAGKAESYGLETQLRWTPNDNLRLFGTYAYNHSRFDTGLFDGNRFRLSPDHSFSLGATVGGQVGSGRLEFTPTVTYQSRVVFDDDNDLPGNPAPGALVADLVQDEVQGDYALVNARLAYTFDEDRFRIEAFVDNLLDKEYIKDAGNVGDGIGLPTFIAGEPRFYGVRAEARF